MRTKMLMFSTFSLLVAVLLFLKTHVIKKIELYCTYRLLMHTSV